MSTSRGWYIGGMEPNRAEGHSRSPMYSICLVVVGQWWRYREHRTFVPTGHMLSAVGCGRPVAGCGHVVPVKVQLEVRPLLK